MNEYHEIFISASQAIQRATEAYLKQVELNRELAAACSEMLGMLQGWVDEGSMNPEPRSNMKRIMDLARSALTKAEGK